MNSIYNPVPWEKEEYLKPVLEDDLLLQFGEMNVSFVEHISNIISYFKKKISKLHFIHSDFISSFLLSLFCSKISSRIPQYI